MIFVFCAPLVVIYTEKKMLHDQYCHNRTHKDLFITTSNISQWLTSLPQPDTIISSLDLFFSFFNPKPSSLDYAFCTANSSQMAKGKILHCFQMISRSSSLRHFCKVHKEQKFPFLGKMLRTKVLFVC